VRVLESIQVETATKKSDVEKGNKTTTSVH